MSEIKIEQALFGYRDGHNLLASSISFSPQLRQLLADITDASGPEFIKQFDGAFTGLPIPNTKHYLLFATWQAPEMPRPGCFWSHALILDFESLHRIEDLSKLITLFHRPSSKKDFSRYKEVIKFKERESKRDQARKALDDREGAIAVVRSLYQEPQADVLIFDDDKPRWDQIIFGVWSQQWHSLRAAFAFSTGSLGDRRANGQNFDIQLAAPQSKRFWKSEDTHLAFPRSIQSDNEEWLEKAVDDLLSESTFELKMFFEANALDIKGLRGLFRPLIEIALMLRQQAHRGELVKQVARVFPNRGDATMLKRNILSDLKESSASSQEAWDVLRAFMEFPSVALAFQEAPLDFQTLTRAIWKERQSEVAHFLSSVLHYDEHPCAQEFIHALAQVISSNELRGLDPNLCPLIVSLCPSLAFESDTWQLPTQTQSQVFDCLRRLELAPGSWGKIVGAMFIAATFVGVREAVKLSEEHSMVGAFAWLRSNVSSQILPSEAWRDALKQSAEKYLAEHQDLSPSEFALCAWCANSSDLVSFLAAKTQEVMQLVTLPLDSVPGPFHTFTTFLLAAIGLRTNNLHGAIIISATYQITYSSLASRNYSADAWALIGPELPFLGIWKDWDRCEKLRRGIRDWLERNSNLASHSEYHKLLEQIE